jgi:hypothetical protein
MPMAGRLVFALYLAVSGLLAFAGTTEAAQGPDATEVAVGTVIVVLASMGLLALIYGVKVAMGGARVPPPEESIPGGHH